MDSQFETYEEFAAAAQQSVGALLLTMSVLTDDGQSISRVYSTHPEEYPIGGKKTFGTDGDAPRIWLEQVVANQQPWFGPDKPAVRAMFFDYETTESLGCGSAINVPVVSDGKTIGSINFLDKEGRYNEMNVRAAMDVAERSQRLLEKVINDVG